MQVITAPEKYVRSLMALETVRKCSFILQIVF